MSEESLPAPTLIAEVRLPTGPRAPFVARRMMGALMTEVPTSRAVDAGLLISEVVALLLDGSDGPTVRLEESARRVRVTTIGSGDGSPEIDEIAATLLDRLSDGWDLEGQSLWFEIETLRRLALTHVSDDDLFPLVGTDPEARDELFNRYASWAASVANRYRRQGAHYEDVGQAASIGLLSAIDRFDPEYGVKFTTYARKTIIGTLKRYLRDTTWSVRVPRSLSDASVEIRRAGAELEQKLGRAPTPDELAAELGRPVEEVEMAQEAALAYNAKSVDAPVSADDDASLLLVLGSDDEQFDLADIWYSLEPLISDLDPQEQEVLFLRFFEDMTQTDIAEVVGVSQMQVSRLISRALERLHDQLAPEDA